MPEEGRVIMCSVGSVKLAWLRDTKMKKNIWPLFLYCLLFDFHTSEFGGSYHLYFVYSGNTLWLLIPRSMREWWIDEIALLADYRECTTIDYPASIFEDKTMDLLQFNCDYNSSQLERVIDAMENEDIINYNVLCPWSCSTSCRVSGRLQLDLMIQRMLPRVNLVLFSNASNYRHVHSCTNNYFLEEGDYAMITLNND